MSSALLSEPTSTESDCSQVPKRNLHMSGTDGHEIRLSLPSSRRMISPVLGMLREVCGELGLLTDREQLSVSIALEEAMANAIVHGNLEVSSKLRDLEDDSFERLIDFRLEQTPFGQRRVEIVAKFSDREVSFTIADQGPGFDVNAIPDPTDDENVMLSHGRGLFLMRSFMDEVFHNATGNQVTLVKRKVGQG